MVDGAYLSIQRSGEPQSRGPRNWLNRVCLGIQPSGEKLVKRNPIVEVRLALSFIGGSFMSFRTKTETIERCGRILETVQSRLLSVLNGNENLRRCETLLFKLMFEGDIGNPEGMQINVKQAENTRTRQRPHLPHQWMKQQVAGDDDNPLCEAMSVIEEYNTSLCGCRAQMSEVAIESRWLGGSIMSLDRRCGYNLCVTSRS
ncbi:uncharacterized protein EAE98_011511 [Botrytis deweyae]|uniref:Uncharacterized protein n=1 Tax=Botrytis deweyae TaxID=2478750 RepID=A0ABQ7I5N8_9HELO|nr:uncharacterized protein EAE98_011511 [Botrytis deweyae]KAF7913486.1 hypothetical protein EAE98_011511 [Botrytis deweyae]